MFHVGAAAHDANDRIIYNPNNGFLTYDGNGNHAGGAVHFATLVPHLDGFSTPSFAEARPVSASLRHALVALASDPNIRRNPELASGM